MYFFGRRFIAIRVYSNLIQCIMFLSSYTCNFWCDFSCDSSKQLRETIWSKIVAMNVIERLPSRFKLNMERFIISRHTQLWKRPRESIIEVALMGVKFDGLLPPHHIISMTVPAAVAAAPVDNIHFYYPRKHFTKKMSTVVMTSFISKVLSGKKD